MTVNSVITNGKEIFRILQIDNDQYFVMDCYKYNKPKWIDKEIAKDFYIISNEELLSKLNIKLKKFNELTNKEKNEVQKKYGTISSILPVISDVIQRRKTIELCSKNFKLSKDSIRHRLYEYLIFDDICVFVSKNNDHCKELTIDEKNFRWALNKYYYNSIKLSLMETYKRMLKDKYCDSNGKLVSNIPSFRKFNYYFYKTNTKEKEIISRCGKGEFMRNHRTLLGSGVSDFCNTIGYGMFDSTICDIFLVNDRGELLGRPILTACVDGYSRMCLGYSLGLEGGVESLKKLLINMNTNKVSHCEKFGIGIDIRDWNCIGLPHKFITDKGREYVSESFSQITDLGIEIINLPPYRPELKGCIEKFFDLVQSSFKKQLATKGVIFEDYQERGGVDYRKKACLTLDEFEKIVLYCIINYNTKRIVNLPLELVGVVEPFSNEIWNSELNKYHNNMISTSNEIIRLTLLPRVKGIFKRDGLYVNKFRYKSSDFKDRYLTNEECVVSYDPNNIGKVWLFENGNYYEFEIIEKFLVDKSIDEANEVISKKKEVEKNSELKVIQGSIDLYNEIEIITNNVRNIKVDVKNVRKNRSKEIRRK